MEGDSSNSIIRNEQLNISENRQDRCNNDNDYFGNNHLSLRSGNSVSLPQYIQGTYFQGLLQADVKQEENIKELSSIIRKMQEDILQLELAMTELFSDCATMFDPESTHIALQAKERLETRGVLPKMDVEIGLLAITDFPNPHDNNNQ